MQPLSEQNPLDKHAFSGNWRDYFTLHPSLEYQESIARAMDSIVATGDDGINLLMAAHYNAVAITYNGNHAEQPAHPKIEIRPNSSQYGSHVNRGLPMAVHLDMEDLRRIAAISSEGQVERISVNGVLVHELFHLANPKARPDAMLQEYLKQALKTDGLSPEQRTAIIQHYHIAYDLLKERYVNALASMEPSDNPDSTQITPKASYFAIEDLHERANKWGIASREWVWPSSFSLEPFDKVQYREQSEQTATDYTDMFMSKHFPGEPRRINYSNGMLQKTPSEPIVQEAGCGDIWLGGYKPESVTLKELGTLSQPNISYQPSPACDQQRK